VYGIPHKQIKHIEEIELRSCIKKWQFNSKSYPCHGFRRRCPVRHYYIR